MYGRSVVLALHSQYLGQNHFDNMANKSKQELETLSYEVENRHWNFERYILTHNEQHEILNELVQHRYYGINYRSKIRHINNGIKTATLGVPRVQILANPNLRIHFDNEVII